MTRILDIHYFNNLKKLFIFTTDASIVRFTPFPKAKKKTSDAHMKDYFYIKSFFFTLYKILQNRFCSLLYPTPLVVQGILSLCGRM